MHLPEHVLKQLDKLAQEGRVTEMGKPLSANLLPEALPLDVNEKQFQQAVLGLATSEGWMAYHTFDSRRSSPGFPDLVLVRDRVVWMELKVHPNKPTADQERWIDGLKAARQQAYVFYPEHWPVIRGILEGVS